jgi:hypothetical protein
LKKAAQKPLPFRAAGGETSVVQFKQGQRAKPLPNAKQ